LYKVKSNQQRPISKFLNKEWIVSFVCNGIFYNISVHPVGSFIGTVLKEKKTFKLAYDNYIIFFTNEVQSLPVLEPF
jgi:hypothetical protein